MIYYGIRVLEMRLQVTVYTWELVYDIRQGFGGRGGGGKSVRFELNVSIAFIP